MAEYKTYQDADFVASDSPFVIDIIADFDSTVRSISIICDGPGDIEISFSFDGGAVFGDEILLREREFLDGENFLPDRIRITHTGVDSAYRAAASSSGDITFSELQTTPLRHPEPVQQYGAIGTAQNKINFVVPIGKNLFIEQWHVAVAEGKKNIFELQDDTVALAAIGNGENGDGGRSMNFPDKNPLGPIATGSTVRISRQAGDTGKDWSGGFVGYLEDI